MTDLKNPTIVNEQRSDNPNASCGEACVSSILQDAGIAVTDSQVNDWVVANLGSTVGGTPLSWISAALNHWDIPNRVRFEPMARVQQTSTDARHETILWHACTSCTDPVAPNTTNISHYRVGYGYAVTMNPGYGFCGRAPLDNTNITIGDMGQHIEILMELPKDGGMKAMTLGEKRAWSRSWHMLFLGRDPQDQTSEDNWANAIADDGSNLDQVALAFRLTPEATSWTQRLRNAVLNPAPTGDPAADARISATIAALHNAASALNEVQ